MSELFKILQPILSDLPSWVTLIVVSGVSAVVLYIKMRGASLEEHVSLSKATNEQVKTLVALNKTLNEQIESLIETNRQQSEQLEAMARKIDELERTVEHLEAKLRERNQ